MAKATRAEMLKREQDIRDHLSRGIPVPEMCRILAQVHRVSESAIRKQYNNVMDNLIEENKGQREDFRQQLMLRLDHTYKLALSENHVKTAIDATKEMAKLAGLYEPEKETKKETPKLIIAKEGDFSKPSLVDIKKVENE